MPGSVFSSNELRRLVTPSLIGGAILFVSMGLACGGAKTPPACGVGEGFVYVDVPGGAGSVSSIEASGACASDPTATCQTISSGCDGSMCECKFLFFVTEASFENDRTCHLRATSSTGQVFVRDVTITAQDARCFEIYSPFVMLDFQDAGTPGDGASDVPDAASDAPVDIAVDVASDATRARGP
jgi:hypothetical protein